MYCDQLQCDMTSMFHARWFRLMPRCGELQEWQPRRVDVVFVDDLWYFDVLGCSDPELCSLLVVILVSGCWSLPTWLCALSPISVIYGCGFIRFPFCCRFRLSMYPFDGNRDYDVIILFNGIPFFWRLCRRSVHGAAALMVLTAYSVALFCRPFGPIELCCKPAYNGSDSVVRNVTGSYWGRLVVCICFLVLIPFPITVSFPHFSSPTHLFRDNSTMVLLCKLYSWSRFD